MKVADYDYHLPPEFIAQQPVAKRDESHLLVLARNTGSLRHTDFFDIADYFAPGDVLVLNHTRVVPARLIGKKAQTGGKVEVLLLKEEEGEWEVLLKPSAKLKVSSEIIFAEGNFSGIIVKKSAPGRGVMKFSCGEDLREKLEKYGEMPLPPYIKRTGEMLRENSRLKLIDREKYQTVYAKYDGSIAAPTAGLHFTQEVLGQISRKGIAIVPITLHVGLGTFEPIRSDDVREHRMASEYYEVSPSAASALNNARERGGRVIAVGTSTTRTLETVTGPDGKVKAGRGYTGLFIYPGYRFKMVDILLTNFHLPRSTTLMLASAFAGGQLLLKAYREAIEKKYRFYSYGDAMLII
jgi:S-adenosylmethionine:tRNA ribosyltransferase-isomerase